MKSSRPKLKRVRPLLGTFVEITLQGRVPIEQLNNWITAGFDAVAEIEQLMSRYRPDSDLSRLNHAAPGEWVKVDRHTARVLRAANTLHRDSKGVFDIRILSPHPRPLSLQERGDITLSRRERVGAEGDRVRLHAPPIEIRGSLVRKTGPWTFDLGGIAKGYAVDCAVKRIQSLSRCHHLSGVVNAGGDLRRWGPGAPAVAVATSAVRTSETSDRLSPAVYRNRTKSGAVTVISDQCLWSDALTKVLLLGSRQAAAQCLSRYNAQGLVHE